MKLTGLFAAVATPILDDGAIDVGTFDRLVDFLVRAGVDGICIGGATGEYPHFEAAERKQVIQRAAQRLPRDRKLLVGIGASSTRRVLELGEAALEAGSHALLLPMPMFFRYEQNDLRAFAAHVSRTLEGPCLLYDLPEFTNALEAATVCALLRDEPFIVGIKDSSGRESNLATFLQAQTRDESTLLIGDDRLILRGLQAGWDGSISGVAACCPELLVALYQSFRRRDKAEATRLQGLLDELIVHLAALPTPWGIRAGLAARGFRIGPMPLPLTPERERQIRSLREWLPIWLRENELTPVD